MALFLIFDHDNTHPDPIKDRRGCYKTGDIVEALDDSKHDGNLVANPIMPPWYLIRVTGVTKAQVLHAMQSEMGVTGSPARPTMLTRRLYRLIISSMPTQRRNELLANRYLVLTLAQARSYIRNKITSEPF